jgi:hypothetical protein
MQFERQSPAMEKGLVHYVVRSSLQVSCQSMRTQATAGRANAASCPSSQSNTRQMCLTARCQSHTLVLRAVQIHFSRPVLAVLTQTQGLQAPSKLVAAAAPAAAQAAPAALFVAGQDPQRAAVVALLELLAPQAAAQAQV